MRNLIYIISAAGLVLAILFSVTITTATAGPNKNCFNGTGYGSQYTINTGSKGLARTKAIINWETRARASLRSKIPSWSKATSKKIKYLKKGPTWQAKAYGKFCFKIAAPVRTYKPKCAANDIQCKARNFKAIQKNKFPTPGVKQGLNPQPEPPSNSLRIR